jgi:hypothetical protein
MNLEKFWFIKTNFNRIFHLVPSFLSIISKVNINIIGKLKIGKISTEASSLLTNKLGMMPK